MTESETNQFSNRRIHFHGSDLQKTWTVDPVPAKKPGTVPYKTRVKEKKPSSSNMEFFDWYILNKNWQIANPIALCFELMFWKLNMWKYKRDLVAPYICSHLWPYFFEIEGDRGAPSGVNFGPTGTWWVGIFVILYLDLYSWLQVRRNY